MKANPLFLALATVVPLVLAGCGEYSLSNQLKKHTPTETMVLNADWLINRNASPPAVYCYATLATPECHEWPLRGAETRLVGYYGPAPF